MDATEFMSALGTIIIIASVVVAASTSLLLLIVSIRPNFMNNWTIRNGGEPIRAKSADAKDAHAE